MQPSNMFLLLCTLLFAVLTLGACGAHSVAPTVDAVTVVPAPATATPSPTDTPVLPTDAPTAIDTPTSTPAATPTSTSTETPRLTATNTSTDTPSSTPTATLTSTPSATSTRRPPTRVPPTSTPQPQLHWKTRNSSGLACRHVSEVTVFNDYPARMTFTVAGSTITFGTYPPELGAVCVGKEGTYMWTASIEGYEQATDTVTLGGGPGGVEIVFSP